jgi:hypothetical protein
MLEIPQVSIQHLNLRFEGNRSKTPSIRWMTSHLRDFPVRRLRDDRLGKTGGEQRQGDYPSGVAPFSQYDAGFRAYSKTFAALTKSSGFYLKGATKAPAKSSAFYISGFIFECIQTSVPATNNSDQRNVSSNSRFVYGASDHN